MLTTSRKILLKMLFFFENSFFLFFRKVFLSKVHRFQINSGFNVSLNVYSKYVYPLLCVLKYHSLCRFIVLIDIICADYVGSKKRFTILYNLLGLRNGL